jgi:hypothetical protein
MGRKQRSGIMNQQAIVLAIIVVLLLVGGVVLGFLFARKRRTRVLRERFGPEYERTVKREGDIRRAEGVLEFREKRREKLQIRPLPEADRARFSEDWTSVQSLFVDDPKGAVTQADRLLVDLMQARGYPIGDFEQRAADISVDHPALVENYRVAHDIALRHDKGQASTEDLRRAMIHYRSLFDDLLQASTTERREAIG